jgi:hypothetical protein
MFLWVSIRKNIGKFFFAHLKSLKKGVGSGVRSGSRSISQMCGSGSAPSCHRSPTLYRIQYKKVSVSVFRYLKIDSAEFCYNVAPLALCHRIHVSNKYGIGTALHYVGGGGGGGKGLSHQFFNILYVTRFNPVGNLHKCLSAHPRSGSELDPDPGGQKCHTQKGKS